jgi:hypothetical protein
MFTARGSEGWRSHDEATIQPWRSALCAECGSEARESGNGSYGNLIKRARNGNFEPHPAEHYAFATVQQELSTLFVGVPGTVLVLLGLPLPVPPGPGILLMLAGI